MKFYVVVALFAFAKAGNIDAPPKCVSIRETTFEEEVLKSGFNSPYQLAIHHETNTLFFSYTSNADEKFKIVHLNLETKDHGIVQGIDKGFATAVDNVSNIVYMGGADGLYKYNYLTEKAIKLNVTTEGSIWQMFYKNALYFTTYPDEKAFVYKDQKVEVLPDVKDRAMVLAVKNDGSYVFSNSSGLFTYNKTEKKYINVGDYVVNGFSADKEGNVYFSTPSTIYYIDDKRDKIEELIDLDDIYGVAVEANGNIIYANEDSIIRLKPTEQEC